MARTIAHVLISGLLVGASMTLAAAEPAAQCRDTAINQCFGTCSDPLTFSQCVLGCGVANSNSVQQCASSCNNDQTCLKSCYFTLNLIALCSAPTLHIGYSTNLNIGDSVFDITNSGSLSTQ